MIERKEQPPARNRESRQTTTTAESGGGGLVSVFAPPYGEDDAPAVIIGTKTPKRGHEGRFIGTKGAKRGHENAGKASTPPKPRPCVVLSSCLSLHCKPAPYEQRGQRLSSAKGQSLNHARRIGRSSTRQKLKNGLKTRPPESLNHKPRAVLAAFWTYSPNKGAAIYLITTARRMVGAGRVFCPPVYCIHHPPESPKQTGGAPFRLAAFWTYSQSTEIQ